MDLTKRILKLSPEQRKQFELKLQQQGIDISQLLETAKTRTEIKQEIQAAEKKEFYPLASAQKRLFMIYHLYDENLVYNMPGIMLLQGEINRTGFAETLKEIIRRHESLRTSFEIIRGEPVQQVHDEVEFEIEYYQSLGGENERILSNCQGRGEVSSTIGINRIIQDFIRPFNLSCAPLLRVGLIKLPHTSSALRGHPSQEGKENQYLFLVDMHHIISDGLSLNLFIKEFTTLYAGEKLPQLPFQYRDFVQWQDKALMSDKLAKQEAYWLEQFSGQLPSLDMPLDFERPPAQSFEGKTIHFTLQGELNQALQALIRESSTTLFMMLLAAYNCLFYKYTGQKDIIIGTAAAGRNHKGLEKIIGLFMETLVFRCFPQSQQTFAHFLEQVKTTCLNAFENQSYPFRELMKKTVDESDLSHNPLFDAMLILHNLERLELEIKGLRFSPYESDTYPAPVQVDINLLASEDETGILFDLSYASALFKRETMERFSRHFVNLIRQVTGNPRMRLAEIDILSQEEKRQILEQFSSTAFEFKYKHDSRQTLPELLKMPMEKVPDHTALVFESKNFRLNWRITHRHLYQRVRYLARRLKQRGVKPDDIVGIIADPSEDMIVAVIGILNAGAAFLPIDPKMPVARVNYMLRDSSASLLLVSNRTFLSSRDESPGQNSLQQQYQVMRIDGSGVREDDNTSKIGKKKITPGNQSFTDSLVYVIYTSGSTGQPKGVPISQKNLLPLLSWFMAYFQLDESSRVLQNLSYSFDFGVFEILTTFGCGGTYFIPGRFDQGDLSAYGDFIHRHSIDTLHTTPTLFRHLVSAGYSNLGLRILHFGGEALSGKLVRDTARLVSRTAVIYNGYGPTEATINTSIFSIEAEDTQELRDGQRIPIGKPSALNIIYIFDTPTSSHIQPIGIAGELCIAGQGLSRGYLNNPELTNKKFLQGESRCFTGTVFSKRVPPGRRRLYRTGDLARWLTDGNIEFLGRIDTQVKVRGYRIELGEIENRLSFHKNIERAIVILKSGAICAYFTRSKQVPIAVRELRDFLAEKLPDYMVPAYFIPLDRIPVTSSGKVNPRDLPEPGKHMLETGISHVDPRNEIETQVLTVWQEVLHLENIGVTDDFFELGGDSITANQVIACLREEYQVELSIKKFFESPFIEALAKEIKGKERETGGIIPVSRQGKIPLSFSQERLWFLHQLDKNIISYHVPRTVRIRGKLDLSLLERTFNEIIRRHEILRTVFPTIDGQPVQQIKPPFEIKIPIIDLSFFPLEAQSARVSEITLSESQEPFDFEKGPMIRIMLLKLNKEEHLLMSTEHHFVHDGWTQGILLKEFIALYSAFSEGKPSPLPELPIQYADFTLWQRNLMQGKVLEKHLAYWKEKLADLPPLLELPLDHPRPNVSTGKGDIQDFDLTAQLSNSLKASSKEKGVTLFITMLTAFKVLLYRYTGTEDLCVGTGIANRRYKEIESLIGMIINTLPLRTQIPGGLTFNQCLQRVKTTSIESYEHEDTPFEKIVEALQPERTLSYTPLFQVLFSFMDTPTQRFRLPGLELNAELTHNRSSKFDINIVVLPPPEQMIEEIGEEINIQWEYNTDIFEPVTINRMINHYVRLLDLVCKHPQDPICSLPMLEKSELYQLLEVWNDTAVDYPRQKTIHQLFEQQAQQTPDRIALLGNDEGGKHRRIEDKKGGHIHISYKELKEKSHQLSYLLKEQGVRPDNIVGIMVERSIEMIISLLAILKAGGAYLPIDSDYPGQRIQYILTDSRARFLVTTASLSEKFSVGNCQLLMVNEELTGSRRLNTPPQEANSVNSYQLTINNLQLKATNLAYITYTSGSTGKPKGVMVEHQSVVNVLSALFKMYPLTGTHCYLLKTSFTFDVSVSELFGWFLGGGRLVILKKDEHQDPEKILETIEYSKITHINFVPSMFGVFIDQLGHRNLAKLSSLKYILLAGETLPPQQVNKFTHLNTEIALENLYGPTEGTVYSSKYGLSEWNNSGNIPIGKPIDNIRLYVLNKYGHVEPMGVPGELFIGGDGVARGYLNNPELSAEKFCLRRPGARFSAKSDRCRLQVQVELSKTSSATKPSLTGPPCHETPWTPHKNFSLNGSHKDHLQSYNHAAMQFSSYHSSLYPIIPLPHSPIYQTGDLTRWLPDGNIEFLGRIDHQVKIRGFRIEPGEIESILLKKEEIKEVAVLAKANEMGDKYLCAYIVLNLLPSTATKPVKHPDSLNISELREYLSRLLPDYMIPSYFVPIEKIPLTPSGKIDRKALPKPEITPGAKYTAPNSEIEKKLVEIWSIVLGLEKKRIGIDDHFFKLGGHSLNATLVISRIHKEMDIKVPLGKMFKHRSIRELSRYIEESVKDKYAAIAPVEKKDYYQLSSAQKRVYILQTIDLSSTTYNISQVIPLPESMDIKRLEPGFKKLIQRHDGLRTAFLLVKEEPVQHIHDKVQFKIENYKVEVEEEKQTTDHRPQTTKTKPAAHLSSEFVRPFDLSKAPLLRVGLIKTAEYGHMLMVNMHHIITDGTSMNILTKECNSLVTGEALAPLKLQYKDFSGWQTKLLETGVMKNQQKYWLNTLEGEILVLDLPYDYPRPIIQSFAGSRINFALNEQQTQQLIKIAKKVDATLYMVLLAVNNLLLSKISGQEDIIVGTPIAGRRHADLERIIGMFVNTLPIRNYPNGDKTFKEFLIEVKNSVIGASENQEYPFEELVDQLSVPRDTSRNPIFDVVFNWLNQWEYTPHPTGTNEQPSIVSQYENQMRKTSKFDLNLTALDIGKGERKELLFYLEYCTKLFKTTTIKRFIGYFQSILDTVIEYPATKLSDMDILTQEEKKRLQFEFNQTAAAYPKDKTIQQLFAEQVEKTPHYIALLGKDEGGKGRRVEGKKEEASCGQSLNTCGQIQLSYRKLNEQSVQLARLLINKGVHPDIIVGIMVERSIKMIIVILAVLKAGGAFLPIDSDFPEERKQYMLADSEAKMLVTTSSLSENTKIGRWEGKTFFLRTRGNSSLERGGPKGRGVSHLSTLPSFHPSTLLPFYPSNPLNLAYIIYTSGTTGKPKGIMIQHQSLVNLCFWHNRYFNVKESDNAAQYARIGFDASLWEIFPYLIKGASLHIISPDIQLDLEKLNQYYETHNITIAFLPTPLCEQFMELENHSLQKLLTGGDRLRTFIRRDYQLYNNYGPTENTVVNTSFPVRQYYTNIPIGQPVDNNQIYILDKNNLFLQPISIPGELCIGGDGLARGYLNNPDLTSEKFINYKIQNYIPDASYTTRHPGIQASRQYYPHPHYPITPLPHYSIYRTGDLARWLADGNIEFLGRIDTQVKIRGFRIELEEIENQLLEHEHIKEALVIDIETNLPGNHHLSEKQLCAYIIPYNPDFVEPPLDNREIKEYLEKKLPHYMIPSYVVTLDKIPLTPNGKVNLKALPQPGPLLSKKKYVKPEGEIEEKLENIWKEILGIEKIGVNDNFFTVGGHSLRAALLKNRIRKTFNVDIALTMVFSTPTIRGLAHLIEKTKKSIYEDILPMEEKEYYPLSAAQKRLYFLDRFEQIGTSYNISTTVRLKGKLDIETFEKALKQLIRRHETLRTSFEFISETPVQRIHQEVNFKIQVIHRENKDIQQVIEEFIKPFDLTCPPLLQAAILKVSKTEYVLLLDMHHIISDGTSMGVVIENLTRIYSGNTLEPLKIQYKNFSLWQNKLFETGKLKNQMDYWLNRFAGEIPVLELPGDYPRPPILSFAGRHHPFYLETGETEKLRAINKEMGVTLYMNLLAVLNILLFQYTGQQDIIIGSGIMGRPHADLQKVIGMFVNFLAMRNYPHPGKTYREFLTEVKKNTLEAFENQDVQFEELVRQLNLERNPSRNPLFDVTFVVQNFESPFIRLPGLEILPYERENKTSKFDITLFAYEDETNHRLAFYFEYALQLFKPETIQIISRHFKEIINQVTKNNHIALEDISLSENFLVPQAREIKDEQGDFEF